MTGGVVGFLLGSRSGRRPFEQFENRVRQLSGHPKAQQVADQVGESARQVADQVTESTQQVATRLGHAFDGRESARTTVTPATSSGKYLGKAHTAKHA